MSHSPIALVCFHVDGYDPVPGSKQRACACGVLVWVSPANQRIQDRCARRGISVEVICLGCFASERKHRATITGEALRRRVLARRELN